MSHKSKFSKELEKVEKKLKDEIIPSKKKVEKEEEKETDTKKLREHVQETGVCSLCSASLKGKQFRLVKQKKEYKGKSVYMVKCSDEHRELQSANTLVVEADTKKGYTELKAADVLS